MEYKGILTDEFVEGLRKEGVDTVALLIYKKLSSTIGESALLRDIEIDINKREIFAVAGKTVKAQRALELNFSEKIKDKWYCFRDTGAPLNSTFLLKTIAQMCCVSEDELESTLLSDDELT